MSESAEQPTEEMIEAGAWALVADDEYVAGSDGNPDAFDHRKEDARLVIDAARQVDPLVAEVDLLRDERDRWRTMALAKHGEHTPPIATENRFLKREVQELLARELIGDQLAEFAGNLIERLQEGDPTGVANWIALSDTIRKWEAR